MNVKYLNNNIINIIINYNKNKKLHLLDELLQITHNIKLHLDHYSSFNCAIYYTDEINQWTVFPSIVEYLI
jgi:hypothetical protein